MSKAARITFVEVFADRAAGHWGDNLVRLCRAADAIGYDTTVIAVQGMHPQVRRDLESTPAHIVDHPVGGVARASLVGSRLLRPVHRLLLRLLGDSNVPAQVRYVQRCLIEVAALRTSRATAGTRPTPTVVLTSSPALPATTARLSRTPHVRFVHHVWAPEGSLVRLLERRSRQAASHIVVICTTEAIRSGIVDRHPETNTLVRPFTVADPGMFIDDSEREPARLALGIGPDEFTMAMIGGWWPYKDIDVVQTALREMSHPVTVVLAGNPITVERLVPAIRHNGGRIVNLKGWVSEAQLRQIYAASDCALVTRRPGWIEETATVFDAARYGTPAVVSDHDPALTVRLTGERWARTFTAGDAASLTAVLDAVIAVPLPRPDRDAAARLGLSDAAERVRELWEISDALL
jgi:glycosyltransferase involved in cell wall biosynthesis